VLFERISWLEVKVTDMKEAIAFYRDILGLKVKKEWTYYVMFDLPGTLTFAIMLGGKKGRKEGAPNIYFAVENVDAEYARAQFCNYQTTFKNKHIIFYCRRNGGFCYDEYK